jgi:hypothetical protein
MSHRLPRAVCAGAILALTTAVHPAAAAPVVSECDIAVQIIPEGERAVTSGPEGANVAVRVTNPCAAAEVDLSDLAGQLPPGLGLVSESVWRAGDQYGFDIYSEASGVYTIGDQSVVFADPAPAPATPTPATPTLAGLLRTLLAWLHTLVAQLLAWFTAR